ncbi:MAG: autotransporter-associated beta strand repeat-containing protein, partial [Planctomycetia bacterium]|nr:autotransporter-associated beta strand repeat-containing protein [Planctomycetia bacterium]
AGTLQIGSGTSGSLSASTVITGSAGGTLAFGRTDGYGGNVANSIRGGIGLAVNSGILPLTGSNTYSGGTVVNGGVLAISTTSALPDWNVANSLTVNAGAGLAVGNTVTDANVATLVSTGSNFRAGSWVGFDTTAGNRTYTPSIGDTAQGALGLVKVGANTLAVTGSNTFTGTTAIAGGVLSLGNASALGGGGNVLFTGGTLQFTSSNTADLSARIQGSTSAVAIDTNGQSVTFASSMVSSNAGGLTKSGSGTLALNGNNTFAGPTTIGGGMLQAGGTGALSSGTITFSGGTLQYTAATAGTDWATRIKGSGSAITLDTNGQTVTLAGIIDNTNTGGLTKTGNGTLVVSASSTYTGLTTVSQGALQSGSTTAATTAIPTGNYAVAAGAKLVFARNIDYVAFTTQSISGAGDVEFTGQAAGYFTFRAFGPTYSGAFTYTGQTIVNMTTGGLWYQGALWLEKDNVLPSATVLNLRSGKVVTRDQTGTGVSIAGITGSAGTFITTDQTGGNTQKWTVTVASGSSFTFAGVIGLDGLPNLTNNMSFTKAGAGTQVLSGVNTYTGTTTISGGRLEIASAGRINGTARIVLNGSGAELKYNSATALTQPITFTQGTISGTGTINTAVTAGANDILSPGNSPGIQAYTSGLTWDPSGTYLWEMNDATSTAGTGWDLINVSGGSGLVINSTSGTTFRVAITSLSGTVAGNAANFSATTSGSWTILSSASGITGFSADKFTLDRTAFTNTTGGTFTLSQVASGTNQTLVLAYNTLSALTSSTSAVSGFRVMQNQATTTSVNLVNGGPDATGYSLSASASLSLPSGTTGTVAGSGTQAISFGYASTATTGVRSGTVSFSNTGNTGDTPGSFAVAGAVVANRVVTASAVDYGLVHLGASGTATSTFTSAGSDNDFTRITVANGSGGGLTVSGSSGFVFDGSGGSNRTVAGTFATAGAISGTIALANASAEAAGLLPGQVPGTTGIAYSASVFSGTGTWNVAGGGSWGSGASGNWTSIGGVGAAPGTFAGYSNTDAAIFAGTQGGTSTVLLNGATPSLAAISFTNTTARYVIDQGSGGSLTLASSVVKPTIDVVAGGLHEVRAAIAGSNGLNKIGAGTLVLSGSSGFTGGTDITAGTLAVNGAISGVVNVANGGTLGGSGSIAGAITGAGLVSPGNSPGILTAAQFDPSGGLDAALEFTGLSPTYASASTSVNDVVRLTNLSDPFASGAFTSANVIDVYLNVDSITNGQIYEGGFFTGLSAASLLSALDGTATFAYWAKTTGTPTRTFGGVDYVSLTTLPGITGVTLQTATRTTDFGSGSVTQFVIVPEPTAAGLLAAAALAAGLVRAYRRRLAA